MARPSWRELEHTLERIRALEEGNPMLGTRGVRLGLVHPEIYEMQARAIFRAARAVRERTGQRAGRRDHDPARRLRRASSSSRATACVRVAVEEGVGVGRDFSIGTMIELPRACLVAGEIAEHAEFFSFGTNDLTQTATRASRATTSRRGSCRHYVDAGIVERSPFATIDAARRRRARRDRASSAGARPGPAWRSASAASTAGDPASIRFFHAAGLDYVSCSPFRVPIARVAAAQAATGG